VEAFNRSRGATEERRLRLDVLPEPYIGRVDAPVVLLNVNPGYTPEDAQFTDNEGARDRWRRNVFHQSAAYPFYPLDPELAWAPTARWWTRRLGPLIAATDRAAVANSLLCVEYFPYHSCRDPQFPGELPSQAYSFDLVERAIDRGATILVMRGVRGWRRRVTRLNDHARTVDTQNPQTASVSPGVFPGVFDDIVQLLKR
jgi:hypothetical protein